MGKYGNSADRAGILEVKYGSWVKKKKSIIERIGTVTQLSVVTLRLSLGEPAWYKPPHRQGLYTPYTSKQTGLVKASLDLTSVIYPGVTWYSLCFPTPFECLNVVSLAWEEAYPSVLAVFTLVIKHSIKDQLTGDLRTRIRYDLGRELRKCSDNVGNYTMWTSTLHCFTFEISFEFADFWH